MVYSIAGRLLRPLYLSVLDTRVEPVHGVWGDQYAIMGMGWVTDHSNSYSP